MSSTTHAMRGKHHRDQADIRARLRHHRLPPGERQGGRRRDDLRDRIQRDAEDNIVKLNGTTASVSASAVGSISTTADEDTRDRIDRATHLPNKAAAIRRMRCLPIIANRRKKARLSVGAVLLPVHRPIHAGWLNQIEIYSPSRSARSLTPNGCSDLMKSSYRAPSAVSTIVHDVAQLMLILSLHALIRLAYSGIQHVAFSQYTIVASTS